jgi:ABC-type transport system substrate-binding protein
MKLFIMALTILITSVLLVSCGKPESTAASNNLSTSKPPATTSTPSPSQKTPKYGGIVKYATIYDLSANLGYSPKVMAGRNDTIPMIELLLKTDIQGNPIPNLFTSWDVDPNGKYVNFHLRQGVKFHDGTDFNAAAVKYYIDLKNQLYPNSYPGVTSVDTVDNYTIRLNLSYFTVTLFNTFCEAQTGCITSPAQLQKGEAAANALPIGTGPFKFAAAKRGAYLNLVKFDNYWDKGKPYLDEWNYIQIPDDMTLTAAFLSGQVSAIKPGDKQTQELVAKGYPNYSIAGAYRGLAFDSADSASPFHDVRVRQAVEYAIDKVGITKTLGYGILQPLDQFARKGFAAYNTETGRSYDPDKAKQLLTEAGFANGFSTTLYYYATTIEPDALVALQGNLAKVGIKLQLQPCDNATMASMRTNGWHGMIYLMLGGVSEGFIARNISQAFGQGIKDYVSGEKPAKFDDLLKQILLTVDANTRTSLSQQLEKLICDNAMAVPCWVNMAYFITQPGLEGTGFAKWHSADYTPADTWWNK